MCPFPHTDGDDLPRLINELVPGLATERDDFLVGFEDAVRQPTDHAILHTLYQQSLKHQAEFYIEYFALDLNPGRQRGLPGCPAPTK